MNKNIKVIIIYLLLFAVVISTVMTMVNFSQNENIVYSSLMRSFDDTVRECKEGNFTADGVISEFKWDLGGDKIIYKIYENGNLAEKKYTLPDKSMFYNDITASVSEIRALNKDFVYDISRPSSIFNILGSILPYIIMIVIAFFAWRYMIRQTTGDGRAMSFGKAKVRLGSDSKRKITFDDVAGSDEEKSELLEIVDFLKDPRRFHEMGARIPKGVLLVGPPGTGKTWFARAVAGESNVPFLSISGSDFLEMYVGVGASRVRDLFDQAKKTAPAIIFIDEIDAVGRRRGAGLGGGHDEREQTLNQLLVEMDGFLPNESVIIMAATNRPDVLDPALLRPGRFDRQIIVNAPDIKGREAVLNVHAKGKPFDETVDFKTIAKGTVGFTPADLENLLNEAAILATRRRNPKITMLDIEDSIMKVLLGPEKKSRALTERSKKLTCYHEAGHAVVSYFLPTVEPVHEISSIPRGMAGGYTLYLPEEDKDYSTKTEMFEEIVSALGGRVAEKLSLDDISTGASGDIQRATQIARNMITKYGMSDELGPINFSSGHDEVFIGRDMMQSRNFSEDIAAKIDNEMKAIIDKAHIKAQEILQANMGKLNEIAQYLLEHEKMNRETFTNAMQS